MKLGSHKVRKVMKPSFWRKVQTGQEGPKSPKNGPKQRFLGSDKSPIHSYVLLLLEYESTSGPLTLCENNMPGKNLVLKLQS